MATRAKRRENAAGESVRDGALMRLLPPIDACIDAAERELDQHQLSRGYLKLLARRAQDAIRRAIAAGASDLPASRDGMLARVSAEVRVALAADEAALMPVVNATGVVLHTNLGRALLAEEAIAAVVQAARSPVNLEYDLLSGGRGDRDALVERELCALTGAEAATVVNNNAAAVLLALSALAAGREVVVSRGELIEIGGAFRIPEVMAQSGARLREVGTTNRTHPRDFAAAIGPETALLMKVHPSNYRVVGFTSEVTLAELAAIGREHGVEVIEDLGSGALIDLAAFGLPREPLVAESVAAGAGLVTFSGDKLLGGPQAGIIVGRRALIERLKSHPLKRALRCDKLTLAALAATLGIYLRSSALADAIPTLRMLTRTVDELDQLALQARAIIATRLGPGFVIELVPSTSEIGSGSLPTHQLPSRALAITHPRLSPDAIATHFRRARPPVIGRISDGVFQLDMRTVSEPAMLAVRFPDRDEVVD
ncbi:MAG TPA: L-seryl-tRNA(Sec) selenium transferase [Candidatus Binataceae bacterium]|nr:L-seryl-tRNA(Sec) selenium transferase [Candidatus Binataceae bacterium]